MKCYERKKEITYNLEISHNELTALCKLCNMAEALASTAEKSHIQYPFLPDFSLALEDIDIGDLRRILRYE